MTKEKLMQACNSMRETLQNSSLEVTEQEIDELLTYAKEHNARRIGETYTTSYPPLLTELQDRLRKLDESDCPPQVEEGLLTHITLDTLEGYLPLENIIGFSYKRP